MGATPKLRGDSSAPRGNSCAPWATPLSQGTPFAPGAIPSAPRATPWNESVLGVGVAPTPSLCIFLCQSDMCGTPRSTNKHSKSAFRGPTGGRLIGSCAGHRASAPPPPRPLRSGLRPPGETPRGTQGSPFAPGARPLHLGQAQGPRAPGTRGQRPGTRGWDQGQGPGTGTRVRDQKPGTMDQGPCTRG